MPKKPTTENHCSFCGRPESQAQLMLTGLNGYICDSCIKQAAQMLKRLGNPARFGFPVFVVLNENGEVIHIQDSSFLEQDKGYDKEKVMRFFKNWTPQAVKQ